MKKIFLLNSLFFICTTNFVNAQFDTAAIVWQKSLGGNHSEGAADITITKDGGFIIAGSTNSRGGDVRGYHEGSYFLNDAWIVKTDADGNIQWQKCIGGYGDDVATYISETNDGGYIVTGITSSTDGDMSSTTFHGYADIWVAKLDESGNIIWLKSYGTSRYDRGVFIQQTTDGGFFLQAEVDGSGGDVIDYKGGYGDIWSVKLDTLGNIVWQNALGGSSGDYPASAVLTNDGEFIVAGWTYSNDKIVSGNHGSSDVWVVKLNKDGKIISQHCYGGTGTETASNIDKTIDGNFIVVSDIYESAADHNGDMACSYDAPVLNGWLIKIDNKGNLLWQSCFGSKLISDFPYAVHQLNTGGYVAAGISNYKKRDTSGDKYYNNENYAVWQITQLGKQSEVSFGGLKRDVASDFIVNADNSIVVVGSTNSSNGDVAFNHDNGGSSDIWILKLKPPKDETLTPYVKAASNFRTYK